MKEQPSKEERKRLLIEMMKEDEKNGMYEVPNFVEPILLKAGDKCVKINGQHPYVDCRIISEDNYQLLLSTIQKLNKFKIQAYELQSASQFKPFTVEDMRRCWDCAKDIDRSKFLDFDTWFKCQIWTKP